jgi:hypothetical protein
VSDPWKAIYQTPQWILLYTINTLFFCGYVVQHSIRSLLLIRATKRTDLARQNRGTDLQTVMMFLALALGCVRVVEYLSTMLREYGDIWIPEVVSQLSWGYGYSILLCTVLILVLFW